MRFFQFSPCLVETVNQLVKCGLLIFSTRTHDLKLSCSIFLSNVFRNDMSDPMLSLGTGDDDVSLLIPVSTKPRIIVVDISGPDDKKTRKEKKHRHKKSRKEKHKKDSSKVVVIGLGFLRHPNVVRSCAATRQNPKPKHRPRRKRKPA